jgi:hypothetical protein
VKYSLVRWLFLRCLGLAYAFAFISLHGQVIGLIGKDGISPIAPVIEALKLNHGAEALAAFPTVAWFNASDAALQGMCTAGAISSLCVLLGILTGPALLTCWVLWLSLVTVGQDFLCFQWDALLLEVGFLSILYAPWHLAEPPWHWRNLNSVFEPTSPAFVWLYRWLLFRLMFESGLVKIESKDLTWANFTALDYHFLTQPLPTPPAYFAAMLPEWIHRVSTGGVFFVELLVPFLIFLPRRFRLAACAAIVLFQLLIAFTGNYAYFNFLTIALCLFLLDDQVLLKFASSKIRDYVTTHLRTTRLTLREKAPAAFAAALIAILTFSSFYRFSNTNNALQPILSCARQCCIYNHYGLFAIMTTHRDEIIIEGSRDGITWLPYEFKYKPGNIYSPPCIVAPMQPRLDWQMWFAALEDWQQTPWFISFMARLFEGSPSVLGLLERDPFPHLPPHYLRARLYRYYFSDIGTLLKTGQWWRRELLGNFMPQLQIQ